MTRHRTKEYRPGDWQHDAALAKRMFEAGQRAEVDLKSVGFLMDRIIGRLEGMNFKRCIACRAIVLTCKADAHLEKCEKTKAKNG